MTDTQASPDASQGRAYLWAGAIACLLGIPLVGLQFSLGALFVPWYVPILATLGAVLVLVAVVRRPGVFRLVVLVLVAAFAGLEWYFFSSVLKLPEYAGPVQEGGRLPAFAGTRPDGGSFTEADLRDGSRKAMVFFRGRW